jgi:alkylated DNA repair dioxygenase AlkB
MDIPKGLSVYLDIISIEEEKKLIEWLDSGDKWKHIILKNPKSRRVQQYGFEYNYFKKSVKAVTHHMEGPILEISEKLKDYGFLSPIQCIVNEYYRNQGIAAHIDNKNFGDTVAGISIHDDGIMNFRNGDKLFKCFLPRRSLVVMKEDARYIWTHEISSNVTYMVGDKKITKKDEYRRVSLTFREMSA